MLAKIYSVFIHLAITRTLHKHYQGSYLNECYQRRDRIASVPRGNKAKWVFMLSEKYCRVNPEDKIILKRMFNYYKAAGFWSRAQCCLHPRTGRFVLIPPTNDFSFLLLFLKSRIHIWVSEPCDLYSFLFRIKSRRHWKRPLRKQLQCRHIR